MNTIFSDHLCLAESWVLMEVFVGGCCCFTLDNCSCPITVTGVTENAQDGFLAPGNVGKGATELEVERLVLVEKLDDGLEDVTVLLLSFIATAFMLFP
jgi:hypothetical protein